MRYPDESWTAVAMLNQGATRRMVINRLISNGLPSHLADEAVFDAIKIVNRRSRMVGLLVSIAGVLVVTVASLWLVAIFQRPPQWGMNLAIFLLSGGILVLIYGLHNTLIAKISEQSQTPPN